jgi:hypothetical protein
MLPLLLLLLALPAGALPPHPRIRVPDAAIQAIQKTVKRDATAALYYDALVAHANSLLTAPLVNCTRSGVEDSLLMQARDTLDRTYSLAFLYRMTGDARYAQRAVVDMRNVALNCTSW